MIIRTTTSMIILTINEISYVGNEDGVDDAETDELRAVSELLYCACLDTVEEKRCFYNPYTGVCFPLRGMFSGVIK